MSALPLEADIPPPLVNVGYGLKADMDTSRSKTAGWQAGRPRGWLASWPWSRLVGKGGGRERSGERRRRRQDGRLGQSAKAIAPCAVIEVQHILDHGRVEVRLIAPDTALAPRMIEGTCSVLNPAGPLTVKHI